MKTLQKWTLGTIIPVIAAIYAFGMWSGVMWVTINEFNAFKTAQAEIDRYQTEDAQRRQKRHDIEDYKFYIQKVCEFDQELSNFETIDFDEIQERLGYRWRGC